MHHLRWADAWQLCTAESGKVECRRNKATEPTVFSGLTERLQTIILLQRLIRPALINETKSMLTLRDTDTMSNLRHWDPSCSCSAKGCQQKVSRAKLSCHCHQLSVMDVPITGVFVHLFVSSHFHGTLLWRFPLYMNTINERYIMHRPNRAYEYVHTQAQG